MNRGVFLLLFQILLFDVMAQTITTSNMDIKNFLIEAGELSEKNKTSVYAFELLENKNYDKNNDCGLYRIGVFSDHSFTHLLLLDNKEKHFIDCRSELSKILRTIFSLWEKSKCPIEDSRKISYIKKVIEIYEQNMNVIPW